MPRRQRGSIPSPKRCVRSSDLLSVRGGARERHAEIAARVPGEGYEPCIVSFIDVLGFRNLLKTRHAHDIRDVLLQPSSWDWMLVSEMGALRDRTEQSQQRKWKRSGTFVCSFCTWNPIAI
jgi:hypothetical protein